MVSMSSYCIVIAPRNHNVRDDDQRWAKHPLPLRLAKHTWPHRKATARYPGTEQQTCDSDIRVVSW
jgi:hypothetical protein